MSNFIMGLKMRKQNASPSVVRLVQGAQRRPGIAETGRIELALLLWYLFDVTCMPRFRHPNSFIFLVEFLVVEYATIVYAATSVIHSRTPFYVVGPLNWGLLFLTFIRTGWAYVITDYAFLTLLLFQPKFLTSSQPSGILYFFLLSSLLLSVLNGLVEVSGLAFLPFY